jgi:hypothetical protein
METPPLSIFRTWIKRVVENAAFDKAMGVAPHRRPPRVASVLRKHRLVAFSRPPQLGHNSRHLATIAGYVGYDRSFGVVNQSLAQTIPLPHRPKIGFDFGKHDA